MIFVFGSNLAGRHGLGAAKYARDNLGAVYGVGEGPTGQCYALPTKDENIKTRSLEDIELSIAKFLNYANGLPTTFKVTPVGCGLAGYKVHEIRALFMKYAIPDNVVFSKEWFEIYRETERYK
jgi:hypothetical protein